MGKKLTGALATAAAVGVIATVGSLPESNPADGLYPPLSASRCDGVHYSEIVEEFTEAGFQNFEYEVLDDIIFGIITHEGDVESISINGDPDFDTDTLFPLDAVVSITYHTYPTDQAETTASITETTAAITGTTAAITETTAAITETTAPVTRPPAVTVAPKPTTPPTAAPVSVQTLDIISVTSPIGGGQKATLIAKGKPNTEYDIKVVYSSGESKAKGLDNMVSDASGNVRWTWKVGNGTKPGTYTITVKGGGETDTIEITVTD